MSSSRGGSARRDHTVALLAIGDEVLRGEVQNTNAAFLSTKLFEAGFALREHVVVSDEPAEIRAALIRLRTEVDVIIATGGLGPTEDDRTVDVVSSLLGTAAEAHADSLEAMKKRFSTHGFEMTPNNLRQVRVPAGAQALPNAAGIAPGFRVKLGGAEAFFLPGVPREMERVFVDHVGPFLTARLVESGFPAPAVRTWHIYGMGESHIDHRLAGLIAGMESVSLHFRTSPPENHVKVVVRDADPEKALAKLDGLDVELRRRIGPGIYAIDGETFPAAVGRALRAHAATLSLAESCTGGLAGQILTTEAGSSEFFKGSVVCYANEIKTGVLGVKPETIADFGAVSEPCARELAEGVKRVCGSTVAASITGIAGRGGATADKPVGTVCVAVCGPGPTRATTKLFSGGRERIRLAAAYLALDLARRYFDGRKR